MPDDIQASFLKNGYAVIPAAISTKLADQVRKEMARGFDASNVLGLLQRQLITASRDNMAQPKFRFKDITINSVPVREAVFANPVIDVLTKLANGPVLAFQNLGFIYGSGLRIHRDSNYVAMRNVGHTFYGCWIALEDVDEKSGALVYYPRSHQLPLYQFSDKSTHWVVSRDGIYANEACHQWLDEQMTKNNIQPKRFMAKKGDCFIWHSDLVHAGSPIQDPKLTRYSLVTHFCSIKHRPRYSQKSGAGHLTEINKNSFLSSAHYSLKDRPFAEDLVANPPEPILNTPVN